MTAALVFWTAGGLFTFGVRYSDTEPPSGVQDFLSLIAFLFVLGLAWPVLLGEWVEQVVESER